MKAMIAMKLIAAAIGLSIATAGLGTAGAAELNPKAMTIKLPDQIPWKRNAAGTNEAAVLPAIPPSRAFTWKCSSGCQAI